MSAPRSITVNLRDGSAWLFRGDIDAYVSKDGILTVCDYTERDEGEREPLVFAAAAGTWSHFCMNPIPESEPKKNWTGGEPTFMDTEAA